MSGKEGSDKEPDEKADDSGDEPEPAGTDEATRTSDTDRLEEIQEEMRKNEKELAEVRDEIEPELREKGNEIKDLRRKLDDRIEDHERRLDDLREELREEIKARRSPGGTAHSDRPAKAAGVLLGVTGALGVVAALAAAVITSSSTVTSPFVESVGPEAVYAVAGVSALVSLVVLAGGWQGYKKQRWYFVVFTAVVATVFVSPLGLPALVLVALAEPSFD